jgi:CubicO group peptidase (beta-lactamase class C family)
MDPIGASNTWRWMGYHNSWIIIDGISIQVPSGGGHWGGGMYISAYDQGRFGLLTLNRGVWNGKRLLSEEWVTKSLTPTAPKPDYGYMNWFLNNDLVALPDAPRTAFYHLGAGANIVYVDPENDLVIVTRWINRNAMNSIVKLVLESINN